MRGRGSWPLGGESRQGRVPGGVNGLAEADLSGVEPAWCGVVDQVTDPLVDIEHGVEFLFDGGGFLRAEHGVWSAAFGGFQVAYPGLGLPPAVVEVGQVFGRGL